MHPESATGEGADLRSYFEALREIAPGMEELARRDFVEHEGSGERRRARLSRRFSRRMKRALKS